MGRSRKAPAGDGEAGGESSLVESSGRAAWLEKIESVYNDNKETICVHFSVCDLVKPYMPKAVGASIEPSSWEDLVQQIDKHIES